MAFILLKKQLIQSLIKPRSSASHKGNFGHALIIAGNKGKMGAAIIAARACLRSGAGLLTAAIPEEERSLLQIAIPEAMVMQQKIMTGSWNNYSSIGIGPGLGTSTYTVKLVKAVIEHCNQPLVMDADALNIIVANKSLLKKIKPGTILTPHPKEFDRLFGKHTTEEQRRKTAIQIGEQHGIVIVLKGAPTMIASKKQSFLNTTGNSGLAKGGAGDALTGIITALLAQNYDPVTAAKIAVYLHGLAADITLKTQSKESMLITDVIENMGKAFMLTLK